MKKRIGAVLLTLCLLVGLLPATALADGYEYTFETLKSALLNGNGTGIYFDPSPNFTWPKEGGTLTFQQNLYLEGDWEIPENITLVFPQSSRGITSTAWGSDAKPTVTINGPIEVTAQSHDQFISRCNVTLNKGSSITLLNEYASFHIGSGTTWTLAPEAELSANVRLDGTLAGSGTVSGNISVQGGFSGGNSNAVISGNLTLTGAVEIGWFSSSGYHYNDTLTIPSGSHISFQPAKRYNAISVNEGSKLVLNGSLTVGSGADSDTVSRQTAIGLKDTAVLEMGEGSILSMYYPYELGDGRTFNNGDIVTAPSVPFVSGSGTIKFYYSGERVNWYRIFGYAMDNMDESSDFLEGYVSDGVTIWRSWKVDCEHQWSEWVTEKEATCGEDGWKTHTCSACGATEGQRIPATGQHTSDGNTNCAKETRCTVCGQIIKAAGEHTWNEGTVTKQPTCTEPGEKTVTCTVCQTTEQQEVPALGHDLAYTADGSTITEDCQREDCDHTATATLSATDGVYIGQAVENAQVNYSEGWAGGELAITYSDNISAGEATASVTAGQATVRVTFQIDKAPTHALTLGNLSQTSGSVSQVTCTVSPADSTAGVSVEYQVDGQWVSQLPTAVGSYPVRARVTESSNLVLADEEVYTTGTLTISQRSSGSSSGGSSSSGNKTETEKNPDGSTTTTVTRPDGTITETTKHPDGSQEVVETRKDGTVTTTTTDPSGNKTETVEKADGSSQITVTNKDGSFSTTTVDERGRAEAEVKLPASLIHVAAGKGEAVALPMPSVSAASDREDAPVITVELPADTSAKVEIPVDDVTPGTVAVLVKADGTEQVIKDSLATENGVAVTLRDGDTVKIVENSKTFFDVSGSYWGSDYIDFVTSREIFSGTGGNTFSPDLAMTRGMIVTVLAAYNGADTGSTGGAWYEAGRKWAMENGVSDGTNMEMSLTREQLAVMLWRAAGSPSAHSLSGYIDTDQVSSWAQSAMAWAVQNDIVSGVGDNSLSPQTTATRAQVAVMLMQFVKHTEA